MTRFNDKQKALELRKQGMSYSQIKNSLEVSKSTLSNWLRHFPLSKERISELRDKNEGRIEKFRETMRQKKNKRLDEVYKKQKKIILPLNKREMFIAGIFLYWGEGSKSKMTDLGVSNTDPAMIKFFISWLSVCLNVSKKDLSVQLQLYSDMEIEKEITYWNTVLDISPTQFIKPYIKDSRLGGINHKGGFGHGTCNIKVHDTRLSEKIIMTIKVIADKYTNLRP